MSSEELTLQSLVKCDGLVSFPFHSSQSQSQSESLQLEEEDLKAGGGFRVLCNLMKSSTTPPTNHSTVITPLTHLTHKFNIVVSQPFIPGLLLWIILHRCSALCVSECVCVCVHVCVCVCGVNTCDSLSSVGDSAEHHNRALRCWKDWKDRCVVM